MGAEEEMARHLVETRGAMCVMSAVRRHDAADAALLKALLEHFPDEARAGFSERSDLVVGGRCLAIQLSPVDTAVLLGRVEHVRVLLAHGATLTPGLLSGRRVGPKPTLHVALDCEVPVEGMIAALVEGGAHPDTVNNYGHTALEAWWRMRNVDVSVAVALIKNGARVEGTSLLWACAESQKMYDTIVAALDPAALGAIINELGMHPRTKKLGEVAPITRAVMYNQKAIVEDLLSHGADPHACGDRGTTALFVACGRGNEELVGVLLAAGADPNVGAAPLPNMLDHSALGPVYEPVPPEVAAVQLRIVRLLIAAGADVNAVDPEGHGTSALHLAAFYGLTDIVATLIAAGANVHFACKHPLWGAPCGVLRAVCHSYHMNAGVVWLLVRAGATLTDIYVPRESHDGRWLDTVASDVAMAVDKFAEIREAHGRSEPVEPLDASEEKFILALLCVADTTGSVMGDPILFYDDDGHFNGSMRLDIIDAQGDAVQMDATPAVMAQALAMPALADFITETIGGGPCAALAVEPTFERPLRAVLGTVPLPVSAIRGAAPLSPITAAAALPWAPSRHPLFCAEHRAMAVAVMAVHRSGAFPQVPEEIWHMIIAAVGRDAYARSRV